MNVTRLNYKIHEDKEEYATQLIFAIYLLFNVISQHNPNEVCCESEGTGKLNISFTQTQKNALQVRIL